MSNMDVSQVLAQIRSLQSQAALRPTPAVNETAAAGKAGFGSLLQNAVDEVNRTQQTSATLQDAFARGDRPAARELAPPPAR